MDVTPYDDDHAARGELVDMAGRRLRAPNFPRIARQTPLQRHFLKRLQRLVLLSRYAEVHLAFSEQETALLKKAVYSVYRDCVEIGVLREARSIIRASASLIEPTDRSGD